MGGSVGLRVAFVSRYPPAHCGVGEYTRMLVHSLQSISPGTRVAVIATTLSGSSTFRNGRAEVYPSIDEARANYTAVLDVLASLGGVDVLHVQHEYGIFRSGSELLRVLAKVRDEGLSSAIVLTMHTVYHPMSGRFDALRFQERVARHVDRVIVHSWAQEFELEAQGVPPAAMERVPHGTLINPYGQVERRVLARELGIDGRRLRGFIMVTPGFLRPDKGLDVALEALKGLDVKYTYIVAGEFRDEKVRSLVEGNSNLVVIERYLSHDEILKLIALSDAVILPYRDKPGTYSVSGILHLSMGGLHPIVGSRVPRLVELYARAPRLTVKPGDPLGLRRKIRWLKANYDVAVAYMGEMYSYAARTRWVRVARRHLSLYRRLLRQKGL